MCEGKTAEIKQVLIEFRNLCANQSNVLLPFARFLHNWKQLIHPKEPQGPISSGFISRSHKNISWNYADLKTLISRAMVAIKGNFVDEQIASVNGILTAIFCFIAPTHLFIISLPTDWSHFDAYILFSLKNQCQLYCCSRKQLLLCGIANSVIYKIATSNYR